MIVLDLVHGLLNFYSLMIFCHNGAMGVEPMCLKFHPLMDPHQMHRLAICS